MQNYMESEYTLSFKDLIDNSNRLNLLPGYVPDIESRISNNQCIIKNKSILKVDNVYYGEASNTILFIYFNKNGTMLTHPDTVYTRIVMTSGYLIAFKFDTFESMFKDVFHELLYFVNLEKIVIENESTIYSLEDLVRYSSIIKFINVDIREDEIARSIFNRCVVGPDKIDFNKFI